MIDVVLTIWHILSTPALKGAGMSVADNSTSYAVQNSVRVALRVAAMLWMSMLLALAKTVAKVAIVPAKVRENSEARAVTSLQATLQTKYLKFDSI